MCPHHQPVRRHVNWPEESRDVAAEVRNWVVNKGLGETVLHKAARLQYHVCKILDLRCFHLGVESSSVICQLCTRVILMTFRLLQSGR